RPRQAQFLAEQGAAAMDVRDVAQHPRPETERVERQAVARQRRLALGAADQVVPIVAIEVLPRDLDEFVKVLEAELQDLVRHRRSASCCAGGGKMRRNPNGGFPRRPPVWLAPLRLARARAYPTT